jgi:ubiquinone/menaquinone biosynthesis C-methylase UbiE
MARISYDDQTAAAYKAVREVPRDGLGAWREAVRRHLRPSPRMTVVDIGAGTGAFAAAFSDWFDLAILAVEPSAAMRAQIPDRWPSRWLSPRPSRLTSNSPSWWEY